MHLLRGCDSFVFVWDVSENVAPPSQRGLKGHSHAISSVAFSPDGESLGSADESGSVIIWNTLVISMPSF